MWKKVFDLFIAVGTKQVPGAKHSLRWCTQKWQIVYREKKRFEENALPTLHIGRFEWSIRLSRISNYYQIWSFCFVRLFQAKLLHATIAEEALLPKTAFVDSYSSFSNLLRHMNSYSSFCCLITISRKLFIIFQLIIKTYQKSSNIVS